MNTMNWAGQTVWQAWAQMLPTLIMATWGTIFLSLACWAAASLSRRAR